jgi:hypothetical protein
VGRDADVLEVIWASRKQEYFFKGDWTRQITLIRISKFGRARTPKTTFTAVVTRSGLSASLTRPPSRPAAGPVMRRNSLAGKSCDGDIPRTLLIARDGTVTTISGSAEILDIEKWSDQQLAAAATFAAARWKRRRRIGLPSALNAACGPDVSCLLVQLDAVAAKPSPGGYRDPIVNAVTQFGTLACCGPAGVVSGPDYLLTACDYHLNNRGSRNAYRENQGNPPQ